MTYPSNVKFTRTQDVPNPLSNDGPEDDFMDLDMEVEGGPGDQFVGDGKDPEEGGFSAKELRDRITSLRAQLKNSKLEDKGAIQTLLDTLDRNISSAVAMSPKDRKAAFLQIQQQLGPIEPKILGLSDPNNPDSSGNDGGPLSKEELKTQKKTLSDKIEKFHNKGWITEELYSKLQGELSKVDDLMSDKDTLELAQTKLSGLEESVNHVGELYTEDNKPVDALEGVNDTASPDAFPAPIKKLLDSVPEMKDKPEKFLEKLLSAFPELDANEDGKVSNQELQDGIKNNIFPPKRPNNAVIKFMTDIDPDLKDKWEAIQRDFGKENENGDYYNLPTYNKLMTDVSKRTADLLNAVYGDGKVKLQDNPNGHWGVANNLIWTETGMVFEAFDENARTRDVKVQWFGDVASCTPPPPPAAPADDPSTAEKIWGKTKGIVGKVTHAGGDLNPLNW